jgi:hypothetical protein
VCIKIAICHLIFETDTAKPLSGSNFTIEKTRRKRLGEFAAEEM